MDDRTRVPGGSQQDGQRRKKTNEQKKRQKQRNGRKNDQQSVRSGEQASILQRKPQQPRKSTLPPIHVLRVQEPCPDCAICGGPIENIAGAVGGQILGTYCHFDCVLEKIATDEHVAPPCKVSYIGRGTFAVIEMHQDGTFSILKRIQYETPETYSAMKSYVEENKK